MIEWFSWLQLAIAVPAGLLCVVLGLLGRKPSDLTMGATLLVEVLLIAQLVVALVAPLVGNAATGSLLEFFTYLISAILLPVAAGFWALIERSRWSTVILGVACLSVAVMIYRMVQIWTVQGR
jgi:membrane-associated HD superfamily phosphohydrolase